MAHVPRRLRLIVVGDGSQRARGRTGRGGSAACAIASCSPARSTATSSSTSTPDALAVVYAPFDEDYGYVTLEAFLCAKPVITATDSGGTLEFVVDGENGFVCAPEPAAIGARGGDASPPIAQLAARLGSAGLARARARSPGTASWSSCLADPSAVSIVIPAMNEEDAIGDVVSRLRADGALARESSSSTTARATTTAARARAGGRARSIRHPYNKGNGAAVKTGIRRAHGRVRPHHRRRRPASPDDARRIVRTSRRVRPRRRRAQRRRRRRRSARRGGNALLNWLASYLTGRPIPDLTSGLSRRAPRVPARVHSPAAQRVLDADDDDAGVHQGRLQRHVRAGGGAAARRAVEDPLRARRREVLPDPAEGHHHLQPAARVRPDQRRVARASASSTASELRRCTAGSRTAPCS